MIEKLIYAGDKKSEINELNTARVIADLEKKSKQQRFRNLALESLGLNDLNLDLQKKGKIKNPTLDIPIGYADETDYKFRKFKQVKGKRKPLKEGAVIERNNFIGDTTQEIKGLNINKRLAQLNKRRMKNSLNMLS